MSRDDLEIIRSDGGLIADVRAMIAQTREGVARTVNAGMTLLYWRIGKRVQAEILGNERAEYGKEIVSTLSRQLVEEFGEGFSAKNLRHMMKFAEAFSVAEIVSTLSRQLGWSHFKEIIYLKDDLQRDFYAEMCRVERWSVRTLRQKIDSMLFERTAISKKPEEVARAELSALRSEDQLSPDLVFRDPYILDFLGLKDRYLEKDLEDAILRELETFLLELGNGFAFLGRQTRIQIDSDDFYLDLLFSPPEVGTIMSRVLAPEPGSEPDGQLTIYDPPAVPAACSSVCKSKRHEMGNGKTHCVLFGQEYIPETWAMANMNVIIHDMESQIEIGDSFKNPKFRDEGGKLRTFDRVVANPMWNQDWFTEADYDADELGRFPAGAGFPGKSSADWGWVQHMHASLNDRGRAAVVLDTGAASRGSGNAGTNKEKTVRQWFVDHDLIESVLYLPENLFYNTTAPGIVLFLNGVKPKTRQGKVFLVNASQVFEKGDPKNFIPDDGIQRLADTLIGWKEEDKLSRIVDHAELKKNDHNISPSRYIHTSDAETYRPIAEIVEELDAIETEAEYSDNLWQNLSIYNRVLRGSAPAKDKSADAKLNRPPRSEIWKN